MTNEQRSMTWLIVAGLLTAHWLVQWLVVPLILKKPISRRFFFSGMKYTILLGMILAFLTLQF
jgi:hypothetical protein